MRYFIDIEYKGTLYSGWQKQPNTSKTIQEEVEKALATVLRKDIEIYGAGRTDAGVHALQLPAHFDHEGELHPSFRFAINSVLPESIAINRVYQARDPRFHARFDAISRKYRYQIIFRKSPILTDLAWDCRWHPDFSLLQQAAEIFPRYNSFESFCKTNSNNKTHFCEMKESRWEQEGELWVYHVKADRFLRGMVRALVGTMVDIARGKMPLEALPGILEGKDRQLAGPAAPPEGLFLSEVNYPEGSLILLDQK